MRNLRKIYKKNLFIFIICLLYILVFLICNSNILLASASVDDSLIKVKQQTIENKSKVFVQINSDNNELSNQDISVHFPDGELKLESVQINQQNFDVVYKHGELDYENKESKPLVYLDSDGSQEYHLLLPDGREKYNIELLMNHNPSDMIKDVPIDINYQYMNDSSNTEYIENRLIIPNSNMSLETSNQEKNNESRMILRRASRELTPDDIIWREEPIFGVDVGDNNNGDKWKIGGRLRLRANFKVKETANLQAGDTFTIDWGEHIQPGALGRPHQKIDLYYGDILLATAEHIDFDEHGNPSKTVYTFTEEAAVLEDVDVRLNLVAYPNAWTTADPLKPPTQGSDSSSPDPKTIKTTVSVLGYSSTKDITYDFQNTPSQVADPKITEVHHENSIDHPNMVKVVTYFNQDQSPGAVHNQPNKIKITNDKNISLQNMTYELYEIPEEYRSQALTSNEVDTNNLPRIVSGTLKSNATSIELIQEDERLLQDKTYVMISWIPRSVFDNGNAVNFLTYSVEGNNTTGNKGVFLTKNDSSAGGDGDVTSDDIFFKFTKKGENNIDLSGAVFTLKGESYLETKTSLSDGTVIFPYLTEGTYTLTEDKAPEGYKKSDKAWTVIVRKDGSNLVVEVDGLDETFKIVDGSYVFSNTKIPQDTQFSFTKIDKFTGTKLEGASFEIKSIEPSSLNYLQTATSDIDGKVTFEKLKAGVYELTEIKAPDGYIIPSQPTIKIEVVDKDGQLKVLIDQENNLVSQDAEGIKIMNIPIGELPHTGGSGTSNYIIIGLTIIICSFILFIEKDKTLYKK